MPELKNFWAGNLFQKSGMPLDLDEYSVTNFRNMDDLSSRRRCGVSNSATRPANKFPNHWEKVKTFNVFTSLKHLELKMAH